MKKCYACSIDYPDDKKFCNKCGSALEALCEADKLQLSKFEMFDNRIQAAPLDCEVILDYARYCINCDAIDKAIGLLYKAIAIKDDCIEARELLIGCYEKKSDLDSILNASEQLLNFSPDNTVAHSGRLSAAFSKRLYELALTSITVLLQKIPDTLPLLEKQAHMFFETEPVC